MPASPTLRRLSDALVSRPGLLLALCGAVLVALWLPNLRYTLLSDPVYYAHTSRSLWETGTYTVLGEPHDVFPPMLPLLSYPLVWLAGLNHGMKLASLAGGLLLMVAAYAFLRREAPEDRVLAPAVTALLLTAYTSTWLLTAGNADLLYGAEFFLILLLHLKAERRPLLYVPMGLLLGIAMLTRYQAVALVPIIGLHVLLTRRHHLKSPWFWLQWPLALLVFSPWVIRNKLTFDTVTLWHVQRQLDLINERSPLEVLVHNTLFYLNPFDSIGLFVPLAVAGLATAWRKHGLLTLSIPFSIAPAMLYQTASSRYLSATLPLLFVFVVEGIRWSRRFLPAWFVTTYVIAAVVANAGLTCLYTLPQCHVAANRVFPFLPRQLHMSQEAMETTQQAVDWINANAATGATVVSSQILPEYVDIWRSSGRLRDDLIIGLQPSCETVTYAFFEEIPARGTVVFRTTDLPVTSVSTIPPEECDGPL